MFLKNEACLAIMGVLFGKKGDKGSSKKKAAQYNKLAKLSEMENQLRVKMKQERDALNVLDTMLKERDESLKLHEERVVVLRKEYEAKLSELNAKEGRLKKREAEMKSLEKINRDLLLLKKELEKECEGLENERDLAKKNVEKEEQMLGQLQKEEINLRTNVSESKKALDNIHSQFASAYQRATRLTDVLRVKEHELRNVEEKLKHAHAKHKEVSAEITHHSLKEVEACLRRGTDFIEHGMIVKAKQEYEKIRKFYGNLTSHEKSRVYGKIHHLKDRLTYHF
jgi:chromosome segregation ATPase